MILKFRKQRKRHIPKDHLIYAQDLARLLEWNNLRVKLSPVKHVWYVTNKNKIGEVLYSNEAIQEIGLWASKRFGLDLSAGNIRTVLPGFGRDDDRLA